jgi:pyridoxine/pyridoxamine 5'-phosphate oxidase
MDNTEIKNKIRDFIKPHTLTVISTIHADKAAPESACIAFAETESLELIFGTSNESRKYHNLKSNPHVSFVIGWDSNVGTVQLEGTARELSDEEANTHSEIMALKNKQSEKFRSRPDQRYFLFTPNWIRLQDMRNNGYEKIEINL